MLLPPVLRRILAALLLASTLSLTGCSNEVEKKLADAEQQMTQLKQQVAQLQQENQRLQTENAQLKTAAASPPASALASAGSGSGFTDIAGNFAETQILQLAQLGVFDANEGVFDPNDTITRAEFYRWLVRYQIKTSRTPLRLEEGGKATFLDLPPDHPSFKYVQALVNGGYIAGFDATHFQPDTLVTREQLIGILSGLKYVKNYNAKPEDLALLKKRGYDALGSKYEDARQVNERYAWACYVDNYNTCTGKMVEIIGPTKLLRPQTAITRAQAAIAVPLILRDAPL
jgi:outer membrane murein-binding lipoprotein Lpp